MTPHKCPVCSGTTQVEKGFYPDDPNRTNCRACVQGVVYAPEPKGFKVTPAPYVPVPMPYFVPQPYPVPVYPRPYYPYRPWQPYQPIWYHREPTWVVSSGKTTNVVGGVVDVTYSVSAGATAD